MQATNSVSTTVTPQMQQNYNETVRKLTTAALAETIFHIKALVEQRTKEQKPLFFTKEEILQKYSNGKFLEAYLQKASPVQIQIFNNVFEMTSKTLNEGRNSGNIVKIIEQADKCNILQSDILKRIIVHSFIGQVKDHNSKK